MNPIFSNRDISWLSFNGRVLEQAAKPELPLMERFRFLSIFSSNLDEFYRVRMSTLLLLNKVKQAKSLQALQLAEDAQQVIRQQQQRFGEILRGQLLPALHANKIELLYHSPIPEQLLPPLKNYFQSAILGFLQLMRANGNDQPFFPKSNQLYLAVLAEQDGKPVHWLVNIPSTQLPRFFTLPVGETQYIIFIDDIVRQFLYLALPGFSIKGAWNIKITRDAELDLSDEFDGDLAEKIEKQLQKRDDGYATRFLYEPGFPLQLSLGLINMLQLTGANLVEGGHYHNLKDLGTLPLAGEKFQYAKWPPARPGFLQSDSILTAVEKGDRIVHTPYQSYDAVLRFFNEAATDPQVSELYVTLYRVAGNSKIVNALITAAENGKAVTVFIEFKARFDEENNIRWSKRMKAAGIKIIGSIPGLKVHAKLALLKKQDGYRTRYYALLATGNLNEVTAAFYTDHILLTAQPDIVRELELLFLFLQKRRRPVNAFEIGFQHLLVAQFNMQASFLQLIDREINHALAGRPASITIKLNNLEEQGLIEKLYEASNAGVRVNLIVRSINCLVPGIAGLSENISVTRIVDRFLEHGRVFVFHHNGSNDTWLGSADWMNRNIYRRIEVCFPIYDEVMKQEILNMLQVQLHAAQAQEDLYHYFSTQHSP